MSQPILEPGPGAVPRLAAAPAVSQPCGGEAGVELGLASAPVVSRSCGGELGLASVSGARREAIVPTIVHALASVLEALRGHRPARAGGAAAGADLALAWMQTQMMWSAPGPCTRSEGDSPCP